MIAESEPVIPKMTMIRPPNKTIERRSRRFFPIVPAITIVSAWNEMGATECKVPHATAPMAKPKAVGTEAKP